MLRTVFEEHSGWVVREAENGRKAIDNARESKPDLIVMDLSMPIMNGLEAAPVLRRMLPTVPIILFTLHDNKTLQREAFSVGVSVVVSKAVGLKTLVNQAEDLLRATHAWFPIGKIKPVPFDNPQCAERILDCVALGVPVLSAAQLLETPEDRHLRFRYALKQFLGIDFEQRFPVFKRPFGIT
jgi:CheY-like chemotaxis protein